MGSSDRKKEDTTTTPNVLLFQPRFEHTVTVTLGGPSHTIGATHLEVVASPVLLKFRRGGWGRT